MSFDILIDLIKQSNLGARFTADHEMYLRKLRDSLKRGLVNGQTNIACLQADAGFGKKMLNIAGMLVAAVEDGGKSVYIHPTKATRDETFIDEQERAVMDTLKDLIATAYGRRPTESRLRSSRGYVDIEALGSMGTEWKEFVDFGTVYVNENADENGLVEISELVSAFLTEYERLPASFTSTSIERTDVQTISELLGRDAALSADLIHVTMHYLCYSSLYERRRDFLMNIEGATRVLIDEAHALPGIIAGITTARADLVALRSSVSLIRDHLCDQSVKAAVLASIDEIIVYLKSIYRKAGKEEIEWVDDIQDIKDTRIMNCMSSTGDICGVSVWHNRLSPMVDNLIATLEMLALTCENKSDRRHISGVNSNLRWFFNMNEDNSQENNTSYSLSLVSWKSASHPVFITGSRDPGRIVAPVFNCGVDGVPSLTGIVLSSATIDSPDVEKGKMQFCDDLMKRLGLHRGMNFDIENSAKFYLPKNSIGDMDFVFSPGSPLPIINKERNPAWVETCIIRLYQIADTVTHGGIYVYCNSNDDKYQFANALRNRFPDRVLYHAPGTKLPAAEWKEMIKAGKSPILLSCITEGVNLQNMSALVITRLPVSAKSECHSAIEDCQTYRFTHAEHKHRELMRTDAMRKLHQLLCRLVRRVDAHGTVWSLDPRFIPTSVYTSMLIPRLKEAFFGKFSLAVPNRFLYKLRTAKYLKKDTDVIQLVNAKEW